MFLYIKKLIYSFLPKQGKIKLLKYKFHGKPSTKLARKILEIEHLDSALSFLAKSGKVDQVRFFLDKYDQKVSNEYIWKLDTETKIMNLDFDDRDQILSLFREVLEKGHSGSDLISDFILFCQCRYDNYIDEDAPELSKLFCSSTLLDVDLNNTYKGFSKKYFEYLFSVYCNQDDAKVEVIIEALRFNVMILSNDNYNLIYREFLLYDKSLGNIPDSISFKVLSYKALKEKNYEAANSFMENLNDDLESTLIKCRLLCETNRWDDLSSFTDGKLSKFGSYRNTRHFIDLIDYRAMSLFYSGRENASLSLWRKLFVFSIFDSKILFSYVKFLIKFEFYREALIHLKFLLNFSANKHLAQNLTLKTLMQIGKIEKVYELSKDILKKDKDSLPAMQYLLTSCLLTYRHHEALEVCLRLSNNNPTDEQLVVCCLRLSLRLHGDTKLVRDNLSKISNLPYSVEQLLNNFDSCVVKRGSFV